MISGVVKSSNYGNYVKIRQHCRAAPGYQQLTELSQNQNCSRQYSQIYCDVHLVHDLLWPSWLHVGSGAVLMRRASCVRFMCLCADLPLEKGHFSYCRSVLIVCVSARQDGATRWTRVTQLSGLDVCWKRLSVGFIRGNPWIVQVDGWHRRWLNAGWLHSVKLE